jgi:hypothetical protein
MDNGTSLSFTTAVRKLPIVSYIARHLNKREIESILNKANENGAPIGYLCIGETVFQDKGQILFRVDKLRNKYSGPKNLDTKTGRAKVHSAHEKENYAHSLSA